MAIRFISFGGNKWFIFYPIVYSILMNIMYDILYLFPNSTFNLDYFPRINVFLLCSGKALAGSLYFILPQRLNITLKQPNRISKVSIPRLKSQKKIAQKKHIILILLALGSFNFISSLGSDHFPTNVTEFIDIFMSLQFVLYCIFSVKILHCNVYLHHYVSFGINLMGVVLASIRSKEGNIKWYFVIIVTFFYSLIPLKPLLRNG